MLKAVLFIFSLIVFSQFAHAEVFNKRVKVPSDGRAKYTILEVSKPQNHVVEALSKRIGPSGTSYSRRQINCRKNTFKYLDDGDTLAEVNDGKYNISSYMGDLVNGSISYYISHWACDLVGEK